MERLLKMKSVSSFDSTSSSTSSSGSSGSSLSDYAQGSEVYNYENYDIHDIMLCMPFRYDKIPSVRLDVRLELPPPIKGLRKFSYFNKIASMSNGGKVYKVSIVNITNLLASLKTHFTDIRKHLGIFGDSLMFTNQYCSFGARNYVVKVIPAPTLRMMLTGRREINTMNNIYYTSYDNSKGYDIVPMSVLGCPIWTGSKWYYVIVMEKIEGSSISKKLILYSKLFGYNDKMSIALNKTLKTFWLLGYAHNDLRDANIIYDKKTNTAKIIDFECSVKLPHNVVSCFRDRIKRNRFTTLSDLFEEIYKKPALSLLCLVSKYCDRYVDIYNKIYNTDDYFLRIFEIL